MLAPADGDGYALRGSAVFQDEDAPTALQYRLRCDATWRTAEAHLLGWRGPARVDLRIACDAGLRWSLNGEALLALDGCIDLDLSFTPATNLLPIRRLALPIGHQAEVRSAWLAWPAGTLTVLVQRYARRSATIYDYESDLPNGEMFVAALFVEPRGWVLEYPGLWRAEAVA